MIQHGRVSRARRLVIPFSYSREYLVIQLKISHGYGSKFRAQGIISKLAWSTGSDDRLNDSCIGRHIKK